METNQKNKFFMKICMYLKNPINKTKPEDIYLADCAIDNNLLKKRHQALSSRRKSAPNESNQRNS